MKFRIVKEYPPGDTHCFGIDEPYYAIIDEEGKKIGSITEETESIDTHCIGGNRTTTHQVINIYENEIKKNTQKNINTMSYDSNSEPKPKTLSIRKR